MIKPPILRPGATLGVICPACPLTLLSPGIAERGYERLASYGFRFDEARNCRLRRGHTAGSIRERVDALHRAFSDPAIDAVMVFWGGYQSHQLLEFLDFDLLRRNAKPFIGYSDVTALEMAIWAKAQMVTFYGPGVISFAKPVLFDYTWKNFERVVSSSAAPIRLVPSTEFSDTRWWLEAEGRMRVETTPRWRSYRPGTAEGRLIAGNIGTLLLLHATPWWPSLEGAVLFLEEDEEESPPTIDRMFTRLRHLGVFDQIAGLVVGRFSRACGFTEKDSLDAILGDALAGYRFPVLLDVDFGHTDPLLTLPIGVECRIDADREEITLLESAVQP